MSPRDIIDVVAAALVVAAPFILCPRRLAGVRKV